MKIIFKNIIFCLFLCANTYLENIKVVYKNFKIKEIRWKTKIKIETEIKIFMKFI
jgi:hypothetical protein